MLCKGLFTTLLGLEAIGLAAAWTNTLTKNFQTTSQTTCFSGLSVATWSQGGGIVQWRAANAYCDANGLALKVTGHSGAVTAANPVEAAEVSLVPQDIKYGSLRVVARAAATSGTCLGFFYYSNTATYPEIDMEIIRPTSGSSYELHFTVHPKSGGTDNQGGPSDTHWVHPLTFNPSAGFHEYRFDWTAGAVEFYVDGVYAKYMARNIPSVGGSIIMNHWSDGNSGWTGGPPSGDAFAVIRSASFAYDRA